MELLGRINKREIFYSKIRYDNDWSSELPTCNWIAFTIADKEDKGLLNETTIKCIDNGVCYTCSTGQLCAETEDYFDEEFVLRQVKKEVISGKPAEFDKTLITTSHRNFGEGFWFATTVASATIKDKCVDTDKVVCIDLTKRGVRKHIINLIEQINSGWLPFDEEIENALYDR